MLLSVVFEYVAAGGFAGEQISGEGGVVSLILSTLCFLVFRRMVSLRVVLRVGSVLAGFCCCGATVTWFYYCGGAHAVLR